MNTVQPETKKTKYTPRQYEVSSRIMDVMLKVRNTQYLMQILKNTYFDNEDFDSSDNSIRDLCCEYNRMRAICETVGDILFDSANELEFLESFVFEDGNE